MSLYNLEILIGELNDKWAYIHNEIESLRDTINSIEKIKSEFQHSVDWGDKAKKVLEDLEWSPVPGKGQDDLAICMYCGGRRGKGHRRNCPLPDLLARQPWEDKP